MTLWGGEGGKKDGEEERREPRKVTAVLVMCDYSHEVQGHAHRDLLLSSAKGQNQ